MHSASGRLFAMKQRRNIRTQRHVPAQGGEQRAREPRYSRIFPFAFGRRHHTTLRMKDENILVVRRELIERLGMFQGLCFDVDRYLPALLARENNFFTPRAPAETNPSLKQIIPYVLLVHSDSVFHYVRGKKSGEQRLVAKGSLGIGGHMNDGDGSLFTLDRSHYNIVVEREIHEEIHLETSFTNHIVGLLNDDSNDVGK